ncbi:TetR family transcriptional regulator [Solwaraspora sp. WMMD791]|uniref:TetR/AcrR family transcriptional regulator n=1 Tax=Solwaraspora sp. WMMD791 TaxID=3016086 RepID=UPI002499E92C|nr:TetR/AcrR family transcriptional regulator [Solwaraspora sp. WMMD791]WFE29961.1 TetR family transcriptional regulator [Solwaraspora sp. WMMD791]
MVDEAAPQEGLRDRTRRAVRAEIAASAMRLFLAQGYESTTMDQIARQVGISRRSLFHYFGTKEDMVLGDHAEQGEIVRAALAARPADEDPWTAIRAALKTLLEAMPYSLQEFLQINRMLKQSPALRARHIEKQQQWIDVLVPGIMARTASTASDPIAELRAGAVVAAAISCMEVATTAWVRSDGQLDIEALYDDAVAAVRR